MKKILTVVSALALSILFTGCSGPKLPDDTLAAAYINLSVALDNGVDFIEAAIAELPDSAKEKAGKLLKENLDKFEDDIDEIDPKWALVMVCGSKNAEPCFGAVVRCDYEAKIAQMNNTPFKELLTIGDKEYKTINDLKVYQKGNVLLTFVDGKYVLVVGKKYGDASDTFLRKLIALYRDGDGETSDDFDDIDDLDGDAVARVKTAEVGTIVDLMGLRETVLEFGEKADDEDLAEDILDIGSITVDVVLGGDELGARFEFDAGSSEIAKVVEGALNVVAFANKIAVDACAGMANMLGDFGVKEDAVKCFQGDTGKELAEILRQSVEIDRSGSTVTCENILDTGDLMELIIPQFKDQISAFLDMMP